jgi:hypothetical protein
LLSLQLRGLPLLHLLLSLLLQGLTLFYLLLSLLLELRPSLLPLLHLRSNFPLCPFYSLLAGSSRLK